MPRIRSIKPEHWSDKNLPKISLGAHLLWISMWNFSDDRGVIECDYHLMKSNSFPRRKEIKPSNIKKWVAELIKQNYVIPFEHNDIQYLIHRTFDVHQKIDKPQKSKISDEVIRRAFVEHSPNDSGMISDDSSIVRRKDRIGEDRRGKEGISVPVFSGSLIEKEKEIQYLCPSMSKIFKNHISAYIEDSDRDYQPLSSIGQFLFKAKLMTGKLLDSSSEICKEWNLVCDWIKNDSFYSQKSLKTISTHIQEVYTKSKNGDSKKTANLSDYETKLLADREKYKGKTSYQ